MAHETAHVCAHHAAREMTRITMRTGTIPAHLYRRMTRLRNLYEAASLAVPTVRFFGSSRGDFEAQADYLGVQYMYTAPVRSTRLSSITSLYEDSVTAAKGAENPDWSYKALLRPSADTRIASSTRRKRSPAFSPAKDE